mgnify:CR=1 FL=1
MIKKIIFIDMDGVLVDFGKELEKMKSESKIPQNLINIPDQIPNIYKNPPVFKDAKYAVDKLNSSNIYDCIHFHWIAISFANRTRFY